MIIELVKLNNKPVINFFIDMFIHNELIRYVAESLDRDSDRLKFNWDDFRIRLKEYYSVDHIKDNRFIVYKYFINNIENLERIKDRYVIGVNLWIYEDITDSINILKSFRYLKYLTFGEYFNQDVTPLKDLKDLTNLTHLYLYGDFNQDITSLKYLKNLTHLTFGNKFNQDITPLKDLINLTQLSFNDHFDQDITPLKDLINLTHLNFGEHFNQDITPLQNLKNLTNLSFGWYFNQDIIPLQNLKNLTNLSFGWYFNQDITPLQNLKNLTHLTFGKIFDQDITLLKDFKKLKFIKILNPEFKYSLEPILHCKKIFMEINLGKYKIRDNVDAQLYNDLRNLFMKYGKNIL